MQKTEKYYQRKIKEILDEVLVPAQGCTEPVAIALAAARAREEVSGELQHIRLVVNSSLYRNAARVFIPGTSDFGVGMAAALGYICGSAERGLEVLQDLDEKARKKARRLVDAGRVEYSVDRTVKRLYIDVTVRTDVDAARTIILDKHTNIELVETGEEIGSFVLQDKKMKEAQNGLLSELDLQEYYELIERLEHDDLEIVDEGIEFSWKLAQERLDELEYDEKDLLEYPPALCQAASRARMNGSDKPAMSLAGSGNQGITVFLTLIGAAEVLNSSHRDLKKALVLAILITTYIKGEMGALSAMCGAGVAAAVGAGCGVSYLLDKDMDSLWRTVLNIYGVLTGMICDGAKPGCAKKVYLSSHCAIKSALQVEEGEFIRSNEGILAGDFRELIDNIARLDENMDALDDEIITILQDQR